MHLNSSDAELEGKVCLLVDEVKHCSQVPQQIKCCLGVGHGGELKGLQHVKQDHGLYLMHVGERQSVDVCCEAMVVTH